MSWLNRYIKKILPWKKDKDCCTWWPDREWQDCCCQHDVDYRFRPDGIGKCEADRYLKECVTASGHPTMAKWMWHGVAIIGWLPWVKHRIIPKKREDNDKLA